MQFNGIDPTSSLKSLYPIQYNFEISELEQFSKLFSIEKKEASSSLLNLKKFLNVNAFLTFEKLNGGDTNAPILINKQTDFGKKVPFAVLKKELDTAWAEKRLKALDEMIKDGFDQIPCILKSKNHNYLVKLGENSYSCIEYLVPDINQSSSIEECFKLVSTFHSYSSKNSFKEALKISALDHHTNENTCRLSKELLAWNPSIFATDEWEICVKCSHYFMTPAFINIYNKLPIELLHGDITPHNIVKQSSKIYFIDFDRFRSDVRLLEFATFCGWNYLEQFLKLSEDDKLFSCIQTNYGNLTELEKGYFSLIVLLGRCGVVECVYAR